MGSRPDTIPPVRTTSASDAPNAARNTGPSWPPAAGAGTSSTSCPSDDSSSAASRVAPSYWESSSVSTGDSSDRPIRRRPGSRSVARANGSAGESSQAASPTS